MRQRFLACLGVSLGLLAPSIGSGRISVSATSAATDRSREAGRPFVRNYGPRDYDGSDQNWAIVQDDRGVVYVGNNLGVLEYDGTSWRAIAISNKGTARSLAIGAEGRIFVGGVGELGYLAPDPTGAMQYVSLLDRVPAEDAAFADVWRTLVTDEGVYFQSVSRLFRWDGTRMRVWKPASRFNRASVVDGRLYVPLPESGLTQLVGDEFRPLPGTARIGAEPHPVVLPFGGGRLLVGTRTDGLFVHENGALTPFPTEADAVLKGSRLYRGTVLPDGTFALSTTLTGLAIIDRQGHRLLVMDRSSGLRSDGVYYVEPDRQGALWLGLDSGIARVEFPSPVTILGEQSGISGGVAWFVRHQGTLYAATGSGVFVLRPSEPPRAGAPGRPWADFALVPRTDGLPWSQAWSLLSLTDLDGGRTASLLVGSSDGVFEIVGGRATLLTGAGPLYRQANTLTRSKQDPARVWVNLFDGLSSLRRVGGRWVDEGRVAGVTVEVRSLVEEADGRLWVGSAVGGALRVDMSPRTWRPGGLLPERPAVEPFGTEHGLPQGGVGVQQVAGTTYFTGLEQILRFDEAHGRFTPETTFLVVGIDPRGGGVGVIPGANGEVYVNLGRETARGVPQPGGGYQFDARPFRRFMDFATQTLYPDDDGVVWFGGGEGVIRYDPRVRKDAGAAFSALIRRVVVNERDVLFAGAPAAAATGGAPRLPPSDSALRFEFAAPSFDNEAANEFQFWLEGMEPGWSEWTKEGNRDFTNLGFGDYRFRVRARNLHGVVSEEAVYAFTILPPWYRTWWAYGLYALLAGLGVFTVDRIQRYRVIGKERERSRFREAQLRADAAETLAKAEGERIRSVELLSDVGKEITASLDFDTIFVKLHERVNQLVDATVFGVGLYHPERQEIEYRLAVERGVRYPPYARATTDKDQFPVWCIEHRQPVYVNDVAQEYGRYIGRYDEAPRALEDGSLSKAPQSLIYLPLLKQDRVLGIITVQSYEKHAYTEYHLTLLQNLAAYTSIALDNAAAYRQLNEQEHEIRQRAAELATVNTIGEALVAEMEFDALIALVGDKVREVFDAQIAYIAVHDKAANTINFKYGYGDSFPSRPFGVGMTSRIIETGEPLLINQDIGARSAELRIQRSGRVAKSYLGVPIPAGGEIIGVVSVQSTEVEGRFTESDQRLLTTIAANVGVALQNARLFEETRKARAAAEEADAAKSAFLSTVSHELRTPLTSVLGFAKIIRKRLDERVFPHVVSEDRRVRQAIQQVGENLSVVVSEGERLTKLIDDVLDLAKIEAGKLEWHMAPLAVPDIVERATAATSSLFDQKGLRLVKEVATDLPPVVGDQDRLIQVVINLVSNAVKFTDAGSVTIRAARNGDEIVVSVIDTGLGIAPADHPRVFEKFKQVGDTLTDKPKGTGLGLPICKEIVEHHGGRIWVESAVGQGSTFAFTLPVVAVAAAGTARPIDLEALVRQLRERVAVTAPRTTGRHPSILAVDDEAHIRELLKQEFGEAGYELRLAANGREALAEIRRERPDLVILDVMMPEINGFDVAAVLKNDPDTMDIPIIILSIVQDRERGFRLGVDRYLTKPIDTDVLFREVDALLEQGRSRKKVMVVDEDASTVKTLGEVLQARGYTVVEANGADLVARAVEVQPDIIILNALLSQKHEVVRSLRFEKGLENVLFLVYQ
jgi:signal transduction histidine kinase/CheY-like chemotaxis protein